MLNLIKVAIGQIMTKMELRRWESQNWKDAGFGHDRVPPILQLVR